MSKYNVRIEETLCKIVEIEAEDENDAYLRVKSMYKKEEIVLSPEDFVDVEFSVLKVMQP